MPILAGLPQKWLKQNIAKLCLWVHRFLDVSAFLVLLRVLWAALASSCSERCSFHFWGLRYQWGMPFSLRYSEIMHFTHSEVSSKHCYTRRMDQNAGLQNQSIWIILHYIFPKISTVSNRYQIVNICFTIFLVVYYMPQFVVHRLFIQLC